MPPAPASDVRDGSFQKIVLTDTWLARTGASGFGMDDLELYSVWGLPCPTREWPLVISPGLAMHFLDGPEAVDLPPRLYEAYAEFRWLPQICEKLKLDLAVQPGYYSDFQQSSGEAVRITGHASGIWNVTPLFQLVAGAAYLDRKDVPVLPIFGFIWKPCEDIEYRLVFPAPKIAYRVCWDGIYDPNVQHWIYLSGELGGGTWAIRNSDGTDGLFTYSDWRVMLGLERKIPLGLCARAEVGYVFNRKIIMSSLADDFRPSDTVMVRGGLSY